MLTKFQFHIAEASYKHRLDKFLFDEITAVSRMYLKYLIREGNCLVNGYAALGGYHLKCGDAVEMEIDINAETAMLPEAIPLEILFEDSEIIVLNKPPEMLVHPTRGVRTGTLLNGLIYHLNFAAEAEPQTGKFQRVGLVHRLDKRTSGLMVVAKNPHAHKNLSRHFQRKMVEKKYYAVVEGVIKEESGTINAPIGRDAVEKFWHVTPDGRVAETNYRVVKRNSETTLLELEPVTGRTNQLRLHCAHIGHPIIGDDKYGGREFARLCLHAFRLSFWHPNGSERLEFELELPKDFPV